MPREQPTRDAGAPSVLTAFRRPECEFWWGVYDARFTGSPSGAFVEAD